MKTFQASHLSTQDIAKVKTLSTGKFDDTVLYRLLSLLSTSFELYSPDNTVMIYLKQHSQALRWEHKFDFRPPKEKEKDKSKHKGGESSSNKETQPRKRKQKSVVSHSKTKPSRYLGLYLSLTLILTLIPSGLSLATNVSVRIVNDEELPRTTPMKGVSSRSPS
jgi:hypothetical protein